MKYTITLSLLASLVICSPSIAHGGMGDPTCIHGISVPGELNVDHLLCKGYKEQCQQLNKFRAMALSAPNKDKVKDIVWQGEQYAKKYKELRNRMPEQYNACKSSYGTGEEHVHHHWQGDSIHILHGGPGGMHGHDYQWIDDPHSHEGVDYDGYYSDDDSSDEDY